VEQAHAERVAGPVQPGQVSRGIHQFWILVEDFSNRFQVAGVDGIDESLTKVVQCIHMSLELAPAGKTVGAGDLELGLGKWDFTLRFAPQVGTPLAHGLEELLGFVLQVLEVGAGWELAGGVDRTRAAHRTFLP
jgi:hypothetical protein